MESGDVFLAYIDPATGAIVLQAIIAGFLAAGVIFRRLLVTPFVLLVGRVRGRRGEAKPPKESGDRST